MSENTSELFPGEDQFTEPNIEDLPAEEPDGEWQDSGELQPADEADES